MNKVANNFHMIPRGWPGAEICAPLPIDGHAAGGNQLVAMTTGADAGSSKVTVKAHKTKLKLLKKLNRSKENRVRPV